MIFRVLRVAAQGIKARPGRSALIMVSLIVGVVAVVIIQAGFGAVRDAHRAQEVLASGRATTMVCDIEPGWQAPERAQAVRLALGNILAPVGGASVVVGSADVKINGYLLEVMLHEGELRDIFPYPINIGSWLSTNTVAPAEIVLNMEAARVLGMEPGHSAIAVILDAGERRSVSVRVAGVVYDARTHGRGFMRIDPTGGAGMSVLARDGARLYSYAPDMTEAALRSVVAAEYQRAFDAGSVPEISRSDRPDDVGQFLATVSLVFSAVAGLSLVVGALGILNIGLATIKERSDELSLRRSFGATRREVVLTIVAEGQMVALVAAIMALGIGYLVFPFVLNWMAQGLLVSDTGSPVAAGVAGIVASCTAGLVGSLAPAIRAGRVPIATIMRG